jgi:hypothetical protein
MQGMGGQEGAGNVHEEDLARPITWLLPQQPGLVTCLQSLARAHALAVVAMAPLES